MADSSSTANIAIPPTPRLNTRIEAWYKAQPESPTQTQSFGSVPMSSARPQQQQQQQQTKVPYSVKGHKDLITPIRYDFESKYAIEEEEEEEGNEVEEVRGGTDIGVSPKAREVLGMGQYSILPIPKHDNNNSIGKDDDNTLPSPSTRLPHHSKSSYPPTPISLLHHLPSTPSSPFSVTSFPMRATPRNESSIKTHVKTLIALLFVLQLGIITLTVSIVLCAQDSRSVMGHLRDGSIITGVVGCASIICSLVAGWDLLCAEYHSSRHLSESELEEGDIDIDIEKRLEGYVKKSTPRKKQNGLKTFNLHASSKKKGSSSTFNLPPPPLRTTIIKSKYGTIQALHLPHNTIYSSRLSNPFSPAIPLSTPRPPGECYVQIRGAARRSTPQSPLPVPSSCWPPKRGESLLWRRESGNSSGGGGKMAGGETWAQRLENRVRSVVVSEGGGLEDVPEEQELETKPSESKMLDVKKHVSSSYSSRTPSRIISLYSAFEPGDSLHSAFGFWDRPQNQTQTQTQTQPHQHDDALHSLPVSPVTPDAEMGDSGMWERGVSGKGKGSGVATTQRISIWQKYLLGPGTEVEFTLEQPRQGEKFGGGEDGGGEKASRKRDKRRTWSRAFGTEGGMRVLSWS